MRLNLGSGSDYRKGWVNVDAAAHVKSDHRCDIRDLDYAPECVREIHALHVLEHFERNEHLGLLETWHTWLIPDGLLVIEVPDMQVILDQWRAWDDWHLWIFGSDQGGLDAHRSGFTDESLYQLLQDAGFVKVVISKYGDVTKGRGSLPCMRVQAWKAA